MIDDNTEQRMSEARAKRRQDKRVPLLIRDDGMLYPNVPLVARKQNFRPYHGDPKASLEDRMRYLQGFGQGRRKVNYTPADDEPFELGKASADEIVAFAMEEFGAVLNAETPIAELRAECYRLSQLPTMQLPVAQADAQTPVVTPPPPKPPRTTSRRGATAET